MRISLLVFLLTASLFVGCSVSLDVPQESAYEPRSIQTEVDDGILSVIDERGSYILADDALDYRVIPSPSGKWLAVETLLFSDLQTIRVYESDEHGRYHILKDDVAVRLWARVSKDEGFDLDDVMHPRMRFIGWEAEETLSVNLSGETLEKDIDQDVTMTLQP